MVLQSKVFIAVLLQRCSPFLSKKRTVIRRVKEVLRMSISHGNLEEKEEEEEVVNNASIHGEASRAEHKSKITASESMVSLSNRSKETSQTEAMKLFTKIPFPEPRRVINVRERDSALDILGVTSLGHVV